MKILRTDIVKYAQIQTTSHTFKVNDDGTVWVWEDGVWMCPDNFFDEDEIAIIAEAGMEQFKLDKGY